VITVAIAASAADDNEIVAAEAGSKFRVVAFLLSFGGTVNAKWRSGSTDKTGLIYGILGTQATSPELPQAPGGPSPQFTTAAGEALSLHLSGAVGVGGYVVYEKVPASA
jgi:hypothetical protein